jgi:hypothetical protein
MRIMEVLSNKLWFNRGSMADMGVYQNEVWSFGVLYNTRVYKEPYKVMELDMPSRSAFEVYKMYTWFSYPNFLPIELV